MIRWVRGFAVLAVIVLAGGPAAAGPAGAEECDQRCQVERAWAAQEKNAVPLSRFYDASGVPWAPAGSLVRAEDADEVYQLDDGMRATRILYHSRDSRGRDVITSGVVLRPAGEPPAGGWPVIVDAHGASGVGQVCAPSLMKDIWYGGQLRRLVRAGHVVVATDYTGLGADGGQAEFLSKSAEANDTYYALPAARQAVAGLGARWVALGHSQGGHAVLAVDELVARWRDHGGETGYLGAVAVAPVSNLAGAVTRLASSPQGAGMVPMIVKGTRHASDVLTQDAVARLGTLDTGCLNVAVAVYSDLTGDRLVRPEGWRRLTHLLRNDEPGTGPVAGPILVQQGTADVVVTEQDTAQLVDRLSRKGVPVTYRTYPGLDHNGVLIPSSADALAWIADRFANRPIPARG